MDTRPLAHPAWSFAVRGVLAIVFGLLTLAWPGVSAAVLVTLFGIWALADGISGMVALVQGERTVDRTLGWIASIASVVAGVLAFVWPGITFFALVYLIAVWAIVIGALELYASGGFRATTAQKLLVLRGALSIGFGVVALLWPVAGAMGLLVVVGVYALLIGALLLTLAMHARRAGRLLSAAP
jgi:uncharacterized membrane protein HdeD (DUF308 family)